MLRKEESKWQRRENYLVKGFEERLKLVTEEHRRDLAVLSRALEREKAKSVGPSAADELNALRRHYEGKMTELESRHSVRLFNETRAAAAAERKDAQRKLEETGAALRRANQRLASAEKELAATGLGIKLCLLEVDAVAGFGGRKRPAALVDLLKSELAGLKKPAARPAVVHEAATNTEPEVEVSVEVKAVGTSTRDDTALVPYVPPICPEMRLWRNPSPLAKVNLTVHLEEANGPEFDLIFAMPTCEVVSEVAEIVTEELERTEDDCCGLTTDEVSI